MGTMFVLVRAVTYATLFIGLVLIYVPARLLSWSGIVRPATFEVPQVAGMVIGAAGAASLCGAYSPSHLSAEALPRPSTRLADW